MSTFEINRRKQETLIIEGCSGHDTCSREMRLTVAKAIKECLPKEDFDPTDIFSFDLSLLLEKLDDEAHAQIFKTYLKII